MLLWVFKMEMCMHDNCCWSCSLWQPVGCIPTLWQPAFFTLPDVEGVILSDLLPEVVALANPPECRSIPCGNFCTEH